MGGRNANQKKRRRSLGRCSETKMSLMRKEGPDLVDHVNQFALYSTGNGKILLSDIRRSNTGTMIQCLFFND